MFLNLFKKNKRDIPKPVIKRLPHFIANEDIPPQADEGVIIHNCGFDEQTQTYKIVQNDVLSAKLYSDMIKEYVATAKNK